MKHLLFLFAAAGFLIACNPKTSEIVEVTEAETETAEETVTTSEGDMPKADIGEGKVVFMNNCIDCHYGRSTQSAQQVVDSFSKEKWGEILPEMISRAELDEEKSRQVAAYIYWEIEN